MGAWREGEEDANRIKMCYVHVPTLHNECPHYVVKTCYNKKWEIKSNAEKNLKWKWKTQRNVCFI